MTKTTTPFVPEYQTPIVGKFDRNLGRPGTTPDLVPCISLPVKAGQKKPFTIGINKARNIVHNMKAIQAFVAANP